jgi:mitochondrial import inner membrane translocase subunit TIM50
MQASSMLARLASRRWATASQAAASSFSKSRPATPYSHSAGGPLLRTSAPRRHQSTLSSSSTTTINTQPTTVIRRPTSITKQERAALRSARKEQASRLLQEQQQTGGTAAAATAPVTAAATTSTATAASSVATATTGGGRPSMLMSSRWMWYLGLGIPTGLLIWGLNDSDSPPAKFSQLIGLTSLIASYTDQIARPSHEKLLPDWSQMPNVPQDIPIPHTLVLDLENTLVSSTWDRKYGWRHAKRPGVDKFLYELAQYYEIVLYSPSIDAVADPVVTHLDKHGCIMHRLYRDATYYHNGVHVKDLQRLNRNVKRMIVIDDDAAEVAFNPENLIRVKPYTDPTDRSDTTLERLIPFLQEIARDGHDDIPALLQQYRGMDADEIADEQERRIEQLRRHRQDVSSRGFMGSLAQRAAKLQHNLPPPAEQPAMASYGGSSTPAPAGQLTAKDIVGSSAVAGRSPTGGTALGDESEAGLAGFLNRRAREKEEHAQRKLEKWNEVMLKKQQEKQRQREQELAAAAR